jgi:hypothetical protein
LPSVEEEVVGATRKKTRLGWGQGLAKYEKEKRERIDERVSYRSHW